MLRCVQRYAAIYFVLDLRSEASSTFGNCGIHCWATTTTFEFMRIIVGSACAWVGYQSHIHNLYNNLPAIACPAHSPAPQSLLCNLMWVFSLILRVSWWLCWNCAVGHTAIIRLCCVCMSAYLFRNQFVLCNSGRFSHLEIYAPIFSMCFFFSWFRIPTL